MVGLVVKAPLTDGKIGAGIFHLDRETLAWIGIFIWMRCEGKSLSCIYQSILSKNPHVKSNHFT